MAKVSGLNVRLWYNHEKLEDPVEFPSSLCFPSFAKASESSGFAAAAACFTFFLKAEPVSPAVEKTLLFLR